MLVLLIRLTTLFVRRLQQDPYRYTTPSVTIGVSKAWEGALTVQSVYIQSATRVILIESICENDFTYGSNCPTMPFACSANRPSGSRSR